MTVVKINKNIKNDFLLIFNDPYIKKTSGEKLNTSIDGTMMGVKKILANTELNEENNIPVIKNGNPGKQDTI